MIPEAAGKKKIFVIAGEASGDLHGAHLIEALRKLSPSGLEIYGVGGDKMKAAGALRFFDLAHFHVTGMTQAIAKIPQYQKAAERILRDLAEIRPAAVVLIDNPGFNLHLAGKIRALNIPVIYYISPQLWAWKKNRIHKIKKTVSKMLVVFDFEKKLYDDHGVDCVFVGHPLKDLIASPVSPSPKENTLLLLPGSRKHEVETLLPIYLEAAKQIQAQLPDLTVKVLQSPTLPDDFYERFRSSNTPKIFFTRDNPYETIRRSQLALACSGTVTLECAFLGTPVIISNRAGWLTYLIAKAVIRVPYLGLPNLILGRMAMPELLQYEANPQKIAGEALRILRDPAAMESMRRDLLEVVQKLEKGGASRNAASEILKSLS